jgi:Arc/MetJ-type ribon-helix-helix transcriptional regulator
MYIVISDETERRLRLAVVTVFGGKKGDLSSAIEAAIKEWLDKHATEADITKWVRDELHERKPGKHRASQ